METKHRIILILLLSLTLRLAFMNLALGQYDPDEFVNLSQAKYLAEGLAPYEDFVSNHPPGLMLLFSIPHLFLKDSWILVKFMTAILDSLTALMIYLTSRRVFGEGISLAAGILYSINPIAIVTGTMAMQEPWVAFLSIISIYLLTSGKRRIMPAALLIAFSITIKYLAVVLLPAYLLASGNQRARLLVLTTAFLLLFFLPLLPHYQQVLEQTILFHVERPLRQGIAVRLFQLFLYGILYYPFAILSFKYLGEGVKWPYLAYASMLSFIFLPNVYYHYFAIIAPFACILSAKPLLRSIQKMSTPIKRLLYPPSDALSIYSRIASITIILFSFSLLTASSISLLGSPNHLGTKTFSLQEEESEIIRFVIKKTRESDTILTDSPEHAYLTGRHNLHGYYWNARSEFSSNELREGLDRTSLVIVTEKHLFRNKSLHSYYDYPPKFLDHLEENYPEKKIGETTIYLTK